MQKAQNTLNEIHEMAKTKGKKFERVVASAGTKGVGELSMGTEKMDQSSNSKVNQGTLDQVRHSLHVVPNG